jgi:Fic family protein
MTVKKGRTFAEAKKKYGVNEKVRESSKQYKEIHKKILATLEEGPKNIPQIAEILKMSASDVTYFLMTCRKFGYVKVNGLDDMDEYFLYELEKEK